MARAITWTTTTGKQATVTVELQTSKQINADGDMVTVPVCELNITAEVEGVGTVGTGEPVAVKHPVAVACIGKLALTAENLTSVKDAINEIKASAEWTAMTEREAAAEIDGLKYEQGRNEINRAMSGSY